MKVGKVINVQLANVCNKGCRLVALNNSRIDGAFPSLEIERNRLSPETALYGGCIRRQELPSSPRNFAFLEATFGISGRLDLNGRRVFT